jgi:hypothetical protein
MGQENAPLKGASNGRLRILRERHFKVARVDFEALASILNNHCLRNDQGFRNGWTGGCRATASGKWNPAGG